MNWCSATVLVIAVLHSARGESWSCPSCTVVRECTVLLTIVYNERLKEIQCIYICNFFLKGRDVIFVSIVSRAEYHRYCSSSSPTYTYTSDTHVLNTHLYFPRRNSFISGYCLMENLLISSKTIMLLLFTARDFLPRIVLR
jgi:hypothetical protein